MNKKSGLAVFMRSFATMFIAFVTLYGSIVAIQSLSNSYFGTHFTINYELLSISYILYMPLILSLLSLSSHLYITKAIRIDDKEMERDRIKRVVEKMKWKIRIEEDAAMVFVSPFSVGIFWEEITIRFIDTEVHINGPRQHVENLIRYTNFAYGAFEISSPD